MSNHIEHFISDQEHVALALPSRPSDFVQGWASLRKVMVRKRPDTFTREEWAYLISFLSEDNLWQPFAQSFERRVPSSRAPVARLLRPRGPVAFWLPNNVSLLGPLSVILMSLTQNELRIKAGSRSEDLTLPFLKFAREHISGTLARYLKDSVSEDHFDRDDPRNIQMSQSAMVRIVFGSDESAREILALPHSIHSTGISFSDRRSQAWIEPKAIKESTLIALLKVFAIYGQAGCTSPHKLILLGADVRKALAVREALIRLWPKVISKDMPMDVASENVMVCQWARAQGWDAALAPRQSAVFAVGKWTTPPFSGRMALPIIPATIEQARAHLPENIQTIGHALSNPQHPSWLKLLGNSAVKRFVPLEQMHHFGAIWDGWNFWRQGFEEVDIRLGRNH